MSRLAKVQVSVVLHCMVQIVRWPMRSTPYHGGAIKKYFRGHKVATERQPPATTHSHLLLVSPPARTIQEAVIWDGNGVSVFFRLQNFQAVSKNPWEVTDFCQIPAEKTNCSTAGRRSLSYPAWSDRCQEEKRMSHEGGGGRRLLQFISSKVFQYL